MVKKKTGLIVGGITVVAAGLLVAGYGQKVSSNTTDKGSVKNLV
ncbi:hypothetical protein [Weissella paramesenteroides]|nr:hypothetical protein [Weissella paramesenteroides]